MKFTRRKALASAGLALPLAGCSGLRSPDDEDPTPGTETPSDSDDGSDDDPDTDAPGNGELNEDFTYPQDAHLQAHFTARATQFADRDGEAISEWPELNNGYDAVGGSPIVREEGINGHRALEFDSDAMTVSSEEWDTIEQPYTIIAVAELRDDSTPGSILDRVDDDTDRAAVGWSGDAWEITAGSSATGTAESSRQILTGVFDTTDSELREVGGRTLLDREGGNAGAGSIEGLSIGAERGEATHWNGYIGEILVWDTRLTDREIASVERHLIDTWDIEWNLIHRANVRDPPQPSTHYRNMDHAGDVLVWVHHERITLWDISDGLNPAKLGEAPLPNEGGCGVRITDDGQYAFATDGHPSFLSPSNDVRIFDVSDPTDPTEIAMVSDPHLRRPHGMSLGPNEDYLYVTGWVDYPEDGYLVAIDVTDPHEPEITDSIYVDNAHDVEITSDDTYAFVGCHGQYVYSIDISDKENMEVLDILDFTHDGLGYLDWIAAGGARLTDDEQYLLTGSGREPGYLISVDVSDPNDLSVASDAQVPHDGPYRLRIADDGLVYTGSIDWVDVWDASDPEDISHVSSEHFHMAVEVELHPDQDVLYGSGINYDLPDPRSYDLLVFDRFME